MSRVRVDQGPAITVPIVVPEPEEPELGEEWIEPVFDHPGPLTTALSRPFGFRAHVLMRSVLITMQTPGSTDTTLTLRRGSGTVVLTIVIDAGSDDYYVIVPESGDPEIEYDEGQLLRVQFTTVGTGVADVVVQVRMLVDPVPIDA